MMFAYEIPLDILGVRRVTNIQKVGEKKVVGKTKVPIPPQT
jgi:hypothetical protein